MVICFSRSSRRYCPIVLTLVFIVFASSNLFLFRFLYESPKSHKISPAEKSSYHLFTLLHKNFELLEDEWRLTGGREAELLNCAYLKMENTSQRDFVAIGWTKVTHRVRIGGNVMALKMVHRNGHDMTNCVNGEELFLHDCYMRAATKLLKEIIALRALEHPNIIKLLGYCIPKQPNENNEISIVTEIGEPIDVIKLLQLSWKQRVKVSVDIASLIAALSETPLGPVALNDFRRQQFVFVNGSLKLIDLDDIGTVEPTCTDQSCCVGEEENEITRCVPCTQGVCKGYNEKLNIFNAGKHFVRHVLPHAVPLIHGHLVNDITNAYDKTSWSSAKLLEKSLGLMDRQHATNP